MLLQYGVDADYKDCNGRTPLSLAATQEHTEVMQLILQNREDTNSADI